MAYMIGVKKSDFEVLANAANEATDPAQREALDILARKVNAAISHEETRAVVPPMLRSQTTQKMRWQDVPSCLMDLGKK